MFSFVNTPFSGMLLCVMLLFATACYTGCSGGNAGTTEIKYTGDAVGDFVQAVEFGDTEKVSAILQSEPSVLGLQDGSGQTAMHYAALNNRAGVIQILAEHGLDPNVRDSNGQTPLTVLEDSGIRAEDARKALIALGGTS